ncbi:WD40/YVTN/BNR-like repeat-containing protein [Siminovitchia sediminis]|uniref:WD40/YVTN/BNR-like repeat-containing protein n=1 Tax=Siminovitchia sediminis TaxID=1274353 RepID=A0ABW4KM09_9BACI
MKYLILGIAIFILIGQIAGMIFYHLPTKHTVPQGYQTIPRREEPPVEQSLHAEEKIDYSLQNDEVNVTFDKGKSWIHVPIEKEELFMGEYNGNKEDLIENSYVFSEERIAFLYYHERGPGNKQVKILYSFDQGKNWEESVVTEHYPFLRFRKIAFLKDRFGYVIISGDRSMSQETSTVFLTYDGGKSWRETNSSNITRLIADGGFVDQETGFLLHGGVNPEKPELYVTHDSGSTWSEAEIRIPKRYHKIFVTAETPFKEGAQLALLVNQGPGGDYKGGKIKGKFLSEDLGKTWEFSMEVQPHE